MLSRLLARLCDPAGVLQAHARLNPNASVKNRSWRGLGTVCVQQCIPVNTDAVYIKYSRDI